MRLPGRTIRAALIVLVMAVAALQAGCGGAESRKGKHMERAQAFLAERQYDKARIELRNVLQIDPKNAQALFLSGQVSERLGDHRAAVGFYRGAIDVDPTHKKAVAN